MSESVNHPVDAGVVAKRARHGISWNLAGAVVTNAMRVATIAVLGRALTATDFGVAAVGVSVNAILHSVRDIGVGPALVQRKDIDRAHIATTFALSLYIGLALSALLVVSAPLIAHLWGIPASTNIVRVLGLQFAIRGVSATSRTVMQRQLQFRAIAIVEAVSFAVGSLAGIACALLHMGPWALVAGYLVEEALSSVLFLALSPPPVTLVVQGERLRELMHFGTGQTVAQIAGILATYGDNMVVGRFLKERELGLYTRAYDLIKLPSMVFATVVGNVLFPAFSRLQDRRDQLAAGFRRATFANALVLLPASAALIVLAPEAIRVLVGKGWDHAVLPFRILAFTMLLRTHQKLGALIAQAAGAVNAVAISYVVYMVFVVGGAAIAVRWGIAGVAVSTSIAISVVAAECMFLGMRISGLSLRETLMAHVPGLTLSAIVFAVAWPAATAMRAASLPAAVIFGVVGVGSVLACLLPLVVLLRSGRGDMAWLRNEIARLRGRKATEVLQ